MSTLKMTDEVGYQVLQSQNPALLERVQQALASGGTARALEVRLLRKFGFSCPVSQAVIGAAYYLENQNGENDERS